MPRKELAIALGAIAATALLSGCATSARPLHVTKRVALEPEKGQVTVHARASQPIGDIIPVDVAIANGTDEPYLIQPSQVFAVDENGQKILPVPPSEAAQEAGDAKALKAGLTGAAKNAGIGLVAGAIAGAALGVALGAIVGSPGAGAAYGAAMGGGLGAAEGGVAGGLQGQMAAHQDAATQINALSLQNGEAQPNFSVNGFVFFPKGTYSSIQLNLVDEETHETAVATAAWSDADTGSSANAIVHKTDGEAASPVQAAGPPKAAVGPANTAVPTGTQASSSTE